MTKLINLSQNISDGEAKEFAQKTGTNELCAKMLLARGFDVDGANRFLYDTLRNLTDPFRYTGVKEAVDVIKKAILDYKKIFIYGDYDCDGIGAIAIFMRAFADKGIKTDFYIPVRADEGYGVNSDAIRKLKVMGADLIITVDCGITSVNQIALAKELGMDIIVTDHHKLGEKLPDTIIIDPCLNPDLTQLCGAGVALFLVRALFGEEYARQYLDICAISTVADVVPLVNDNRIVVKYGLELIRRGITKIGIKTLINKSGVSIRQVSSYDIGFKIAPRLNASGRLNTAHKSVRILATDDETEAIFIADELNIQNAQRQELGNKIIEDAMEMLKEYDFSRYRIILLYNPDWQEGVNGIAASRITEYFNMPSILFTKNADGLLKGSSRSISEVNIFDLLNAHKDLMEAFGGHAMAAGLTIKEDNLSILRDKLNDDLLIQSEKPTERTIKYDADLSIDKLNATAMEIIKFFEPFGHKNPIPLFYDNKPRTSFTVLKGRHIKGMSHFGEMIYFNKASILPAYDNSSERGMLYSIDKNYFNGKEKNQINIKKITFENFRVDKELLMERFIEFSCEIKNRPLIPHRAKRLNGAKLHVFFDNDNFEEFCVKNHNIKQVYADMDNFDDMETAVLSPSFDFPFEYYSRIYIYNKLSNSAKKFFDNISAEYIDNEVILLPRFDVDEMRFSYKKIREYYYNPYKKKCFSTHDIYSELLRNGYNLIVEKFVLHFFILIELNLLKHQNGDIIITDTNKVDISQSDIIGYIDGSRA